jgi:hypothetical protein
MEASNEDAGLAYAMYLLVAAASLWSASLSEVL